MVEAVCFSESLVNFHRTIWPYILHASILHNHCCENLKFYILFYSWGPKYHLLKCGPVFKEYYALSVHCMHLIVLHFGICLFPDWLSLCIVFAVDTRASQKTY
jgi:hypothetical protein